MALYFLSFKGISYVMIWFTNVLIKLVIIATIIRHENRKVTNLI
jgi:hypothetical protein